MSDLNKLISLCTCCPRNTSVQEKPICIQRFMGGRSRSIFKSHSKLFACYFIIRVINSTGFDILQRVLKFEIGSMPELIQFT